MKLTRMTQGLLLALALGAGTAALAQVSFSINVGPPQPLYEPIPVMPQGYVWAPGYWAWNHDQHIWIRGRSMVQRTGYRWEPDRWEQRGSTYYRQPGSWARDHDARPFQAQRVQKPKKPHPNPQQRGRWDERPGNSLRR